ncbi:MAG: alpha/beta hydrolase [Rhodobacteraceae bacterium]|nr:alpha/beta hydrolase [Paracoccaceae bacterium]
MDYSRLIDEETWEFIRRTADFYPPDAVTMTIADQRRVYDRMCRAFFQGYPQGVTATDRTAFGVPVRVYEKGETDTNIAYFHGGGFVVGGLDSHDDVCAEICDRTGFRVISADYRLSPEHKHPAAFDDAFSAVQYVTQTWPGTLLLVGDSAGANLAAAVAHHARGKIDIAGQVLIYGAFGGNMDKGSYLRHANAPMLTLDDVLFYMDVRFEGGAPDNDPTAAPLHDTDFSNLPPSLIISAECDPLGDDGRAYRDAIRAAGGQAVWIEEKGLVHGYLRARDTVARARSSFTRIIDTILALGHGKPFPPDL